MKTVLGLDVGTNSIGWAYLEEGSYSNNRINGHLLDCGVRIFPQAIEKKTPTPKNAKRRQARLMRRVIQRRARRKRRLENYLVSKGWLPSDITDSVHRERMLNKIGDPYALRAQAVVQALSKHELGRVILHIGQRRGFLSNKKTLAGDLRDDPNIEELLNEENAQSKEYLDKDAKKEEGEFKKSIAELRNAMKEHGTESTLGQYLHSLQKADEESCVRNRVHAYSGSLRTERKMYQDELEKIFKAQQKHFPDLTAEVQDEIRNIIFYQRPLKLKKSRIGKCTFEPGSYRCAQARLEAQRFRYLQFLNDIEYCDPTENRYKKLDAEQRRTIQKHLEKTKKITIAGFKKKVGFKRTVGLNYETTDFNRQAKGNVTACDLRAILADWDDWNGEKQNHLVEDLLTIQSKKTLLKRLCGPSWGFEKGTAYKLCLLELEPGHARLSLKAIRKILPHLENGLVYSEACAQAGYDHSFSQEESAPAVREHLPSAPSLPNPVVGRGLSELRRVVNAIIAKHGKPDIIRIELAREITMSKKQKTELNRRNKMNEKRNEAADDAYSRYTATQGLSTQMNKKDARERYRLWQDQEHQCAYSGHSISESQLFTPVLEIDHVLPLSKSLDDSYMNKVLCFTEENRKKGCRTPIDAFAGDEEKWEAMQSRIKKWDQSLGSKCKKFYITEEEMQKPDFTKSQLVNTQYFAREATRYLKTLGTEVTATKGNAVAWLRHQWGLNKLISEMDYKNRTDHRHHAIDAVVIALTNRSLYQLLAKCAKLKEERIEAKYKAPDILDTLYTEIGEKIDKLLVSHAASRKITGALHKETGYGYSEKSGRMVTRQRLDQKFKEKQIENIVDPVVREQIRKHLAVHGGKPGIAFADDKTVLHKDGKTPIKRVRVWKAKKAVTLEEIQRTCIGIKDRIRGRQFRWMEYGNTHCVQIFKDEESGKISPHFITVHEAAQKQAGSGSSALETEAEHAKGELLMVLHANDTVQSTDKNGEKAYYRVQKFEQSANGVVLRKITAATLGSENEKLRSTIGKLMQEYGMEKVEIDVLGQLSHPR